ncbi:heterocyst-inhibiting protein PatX [Coleofasciculus sp. FACHB-125]|uniref:heterocyst-inhibiting protein PatX n=1 Tax=Coleofasciculus sp. FACHB-125 TaxID=2692784 RepID=UPI00403F67F7
MRLYSSLFLSSLLVTGFAVNLPNLRDRSENLHQADSTQKHLFTHDSRQDSAHRGSGRRGKGNSEAALRGLFHLDLT